MNKNELSKYFENNMRQFLNLLGENVTIVEKSIGYGAFSTVHVIEEKIGDRTIQSALKIELIAEEGHTDSQRQTFIEKRKERVEAEAAIMQRLRKCPNIVKYYSHVIRPVIINGKIEGYVCLLKMELLKDFSNAVNHIAFTEQNVIKIAMDIGRGIQAAHEKGIIHRDIKPENFFISDTGTYKLGDFNVSKEATTAHTFAGAHGYIAPEIYQAKTESDKKYTCQADLYSFGICLYQFMNDMYFPFESKNCDADEALDIRMKGKVLPEPKHGSMALRKIILKACEFETSDRYQTIDELLTNLEQLSKKEEVTIPKPISKPPKKERGVTIVADPPKPDERPVSKVNTQTLIMIACFLLAFLCVAMLFIFMLKDDTDNEAQTVSKLENTTETNVPLENRDSNEYEYQTVCPVCGNTIPVTSERLNAGRMFCPNCGQELLFVNDEEQNAGENSETIILPDTAQDSAVTESPITAPPTTEPPVTSPPETEPPTMPPQTLPPVTEVPVDLVPSFSTASSSSNLKPVYSNNKQYTYEAYKALDGDYSTCWCEGADDSGVGEYITLYAERKQRLDEIVIYNGLCTDEELFYKNCRIKECRIEFSDGTYKDAVLDGEYGNQPSIIELHDTVDTEYIKITILSTYSGNKYSDTCVTEIKVRNNS